MNEDEATKASIAEIRAYIAKQEAIKAQEQEALAASQMAQAAEQERLLKEQIEKELDPVILYKRRRAARTF